MIKTQSPPPARVPPAPEVYREYQRQQGLIEEEDIGGLYNCYILKEYLPRFTAQSTVGLSLFFKTPRAWHGSPTATIHRATNLIAKLHNKVPREIVRKLFTLSELYAQNIEWQPTLGPNDHYTDPGNGGEGSSHSMDSSTLGQHPEISHTAGQNSASNSPGLAIQHCISEGRNKRCVGVGEHSKGCHGRSVRKRALRSPSSEVESAKIKTSWGPDSTSAQAISFFTDVWNFPHTPPRSP